MVTAVLGTRTEIDSSSKLNTGIQGGQARVKTIITNKLSLPKKNLILTLSLKDSDSSTWDQVTGQKTGC